MGLEEHDHGKGRLLLRLDLIDLAAGLDLIETIGECHHFTIQGVERADTEIAMPGNICISHVALVNALKQSTDCRNLKDLIGGSRFDMQPLALQSSQIFDEVLH